MARKGDTDWGFASVEMFGKNDGEEMYQEWVLRIHYRVTMESSPGFLDRITGNAEPPHPAELDPVEWEVAYEAEAVPWNDLVWYSIDPSDLKRIFGPNWADRLEDTCYQHALEKLW